MDQQTRELTRQFQQGDLSLAEQIVRTYLRAGIPLTNLVNPDNAFAGLLVSSNHYDADFLASLLTPAAHRLAAIYLKHTLGYIFNDIPDWCDFLWERDDPQSFKSYRNLDSAWKEKTKTELCQSTRDNLRSIVQGMLLWTPEVEIAEHQDLNGRIITYPEAREISVTIEMTQRSLGKALSRLENPTDPKWVVDFVDVMHLLANRYVMLRGEFVGAIIDDCQVIAEEVGNTSPGELFAICAPDILRFIHTTDTKKTYDWQIRISLDPGQVENMPTETEPVRELLLQYPFQHPWDDVPLAARPDGDENFAEDETWDDTYGLLWAFYTKFVGSTDEMAAIQRQLRHRLNENRYPGDIENNPWRVEPIVTEW